MVHGTTLLGFVSEEIIPGPLHFITFQRLGIFQQDEVFLVSKRI